VRGILSDFYDRVGQSDKYDFYGFNTDSLIGTDGKAMNNNLNIGALSCTALLNSGTRSGFKWDPNRRGRPKYYVPEFTESLVSGISIISADGVILDTMTRRSRGSNQFNSRSRSVSQLISAGGRPLYVQIALSSGENLCDRQDLPENLN